jgi:hypothetical protein
VGSAVELCAKARLGITRQQASTKAAHRRYLSAASTYVMCERYLTWAV